ncbi:MAG TPA: helix-turn-helix domain-containing protein [Acidimicrobiales bacterium]|nr:helix-turn-helix domain-containing protein [Acidimicrobiales bacterium]
MNAQPNHPRNIPHLLSIEQVAERLGVTVRHVRRLVFERRITYVKWGHLLRFEPESVDRFIGANTYESGRRGASGARGNAPSGQNVTGAP